MTAAWKKVPPFLMKISPLMAFHPRLEDLGNTMVRIPLRAAFFQLVLCVLGVAKLVVTQATDTRTSSPSPSPSQPSSSFSNFDLFKNTGFHLPCNSWEIATSDLRVTYEFDTYSSHNITYGKSPAKTQEEFCEVFPDQPIPIATEPTPAAFLPAWPSLFISCISLLVSFYLLLRAVNKKDIDDGVSINHLFWSILIFDVARVVIWWVEVIMSARNLLHAGWPSVVIWTVPFGYAVLTRHIKQALRTDSTWWATTLKWYTFFHWGFCLAIIVIRWQFRHTSQGSYVPIDYAAQAANFPGRCKDLDVLTERTDFFSDPYVQWFRVTQTIQYMVCTGGFVWVFLNLAGNHDPSELPRTNWFGAKVAVSVALGLSYAAMAFFQLALWATKGPGFRLAVGECNLVMLTMSSKVGYFDVQKDMVWRIVQSVFSIY